MIWAFAVSHGKTDARFKTAIVCAVILAASVSFSEAMTPPVTAVGAAVEAELEIERILAGANPELLKTYFRNAEKPPYHRGRALRAYFGKKKIPVNDADRALLTDALGDAEVPVRLAGVKVTGDMREQSLVRTLLDLAANDPDLNVRKTALESARPWTRLTHLYFLEKALEDKADQVRAEAVASIANLSTKELTPPIVERIRGLLSPANPPLVRRAALDCMRRWGLLDWEMLRQVIADHYAAETLRIYAIKLSDDVQEGAGERIYTLTEILNREMSVNLGWWAFKRLKNVLRNDRNFHLSLGNLLISTTQMNSATWEIASFLKTVGVKAEYKGGGWKVVYK